MFVSGNVTLQPTFLMLMGTFVFPKTLANSSLQGWRYTEGSPNLIRTIENFCSQTFMGDK